MDAIPVYGGSYKAGQAPYSSAGGGGLGWLKRGRGGDGDRTRLLGSVTSVNRGPLVPDGVGAGYGSGSTALYDVDGGPSDVSGGYYGNAMQYPRFASFARPSFAGVGGGGGQLSFAAGGGIAALSSQKSFARPAGSSPLAPGGSLSEPAPLSRQRLSISGRLLRLGGRGGDTGDADGDDGGDGGGSLWEPHQLQASLQSEYFSAASSSSGGGGGGGSAVQPLQRSRSQSRKMTATVLAVEPMTGPGELTPMAAADAMPLPRILANSPTVRQAPPSAPLVAVIGGSGTNLAISSPLAKAPS